MKARSKYTLMATMVGIMPGLAAAPIAAQSMTEMLGERTMPFEQCAAYIQFVEKTLSVTPKYTVNSESSKIAQFPLTDGSGKTLLVICSRPDQKLFVSMITTKTP